MPLAEAIVRRLPSGYEGAAEDLATRLLAAARFVPDDYSLVLGGSLARGEPAIKLGSGGYELISDIDLLVVHGAGNPSESLSDVRRKLCAAIPGATVMSVPLDSYRRLGTSLGYDFRDGGIPLSASELPATDPVKVSARDGCEVFLYALGLYFSLELGERWLAGENSAEFHYAHSRISGKIIRSVGMLHGFHNQHDVMLAPQHFFDEAVDELTWLRDPRKVPSLPPARVWTIAARALSAHDRFFGGYVVDAVSDTEYSGRPGADYVAVHQGVAVDVVRHIVSVYDPALHGIRRFREAKSSAWQSIQASGRAEGCRTPEQFFSMRIAKIQDQLLRMKL